VGLGDRFHYFRGSSGRRYLFSALAEADIAGFHSAVVMIARPAAHGRLAAHWIAALDASGRPVAGDRRWPLAIARDAVVLVHLLSEDEQQRRDLVADLTAVPALALAA
jgi:hypothetical protein